MSTSRIEGLYAITDPALIDAHELVDGVRGVIQNGARVIQYRNKTDDRHLREHQALELVKLCRSYHVPLIVNDDIAVADSVHADGVHLGRHDHLVTDARRTLGDHALIGVSCYNSLERAVAAEQDGADYVAIGRFFPSYTKPDAAEATLDLLRAVKARLKIPVVAIGGITMENAALLIEAGADAVAVIHGLFAQPDPAGTARRFARLFQTHR
ncbi:MAG: thiamine-phosphate pyrophosphorylase [Gammaproteobacteria bacterium]|nr:MAG: thiamine-phosphate pyrophosphorylase [Gammaproteobacteria bacterium]TND03958.1 MAG: thiamine-phosphate pyrophosphorylase [Gammaproteobacteria bacterium]